MLRPIMRCLCGLSCLLLAWTASVQTAAAGPKKVSSSGMPIAASEPAPPHTSTGKDQFKRYLADAFGPGAWLGAGASAGAAQWDDSPPEWGQGAEGYGLRYGSAFGQGFVEKTILHGLSAPLGQDPTYYRCDCNGFFPRLGHALLSSFTALNGNDKRVFSVPRVVAPFAAGQIAANGWYPDRFGPKDGLRIGARAFGVNAALNVFKEFIYGGKRHH